MEDPKEYYKSNINNINKNLKNWREQYPLLQWEDYS